MVRSRKPIISQLTPDAASAIRAARAGNCRQAFAYLHDARPSRQTRSGKCVDNTGTDVCKAHQVASIIFDKLCLKGKVKYPRYHLSGAGRRRRKRR